MATILLSINPEYVNRIISGEKRYEFRKHLPQNKVERIIIYSTNPVKQVIGEVSVIDTITTSPSKMWELTKGSAGISRAKFRLYFRNCKTAFAFELGNVKIYDLPRCLIDYGVKQAPQSFIYVPDDLLLDEK